MDELEGRTCEVCNVQATVAVRDLRETAPTERWWAMWEYDGPWHCFCQKHKRDSRQKLLTHEELRAIAEARGLTQRDLIMLGLAESERYWGSHD